MGLSDNLRIRVRDNATTHRWTDDELDTMLNDAIEHVNRDFGQTIGYITLGGSDPTVPAGYNSVLMLRATIIVGQSDIADPDKYTLFITQDTTIDPAKALEALRKRLKDLIDEYNDLIARFGTSSARTVSYDGNATGILEAD